MRQFSLSAIWFVLSFAATVSAQQGLVQYQDKDDPCARFKMRILVPADRAGVKLRAQKPKDGIDSLIVRNPCPSPEPQFAFELSKRPPAHAANFLTPGSLGLSYATPKSGKKQSAEFPFPQPPTPFDKWLQR
jgi:hypothetical protein